MATITRYVWTESNNVIPQGSTVIHGDDDSTWSLPRPPIPDPVRWVQGAFDQQDMPSTTGSAHADEGEWRPLTNALVEPNRGMPLWLYEQQEMPLLIGLDDGGNVFYSNYSDGLSLLDPGGWDNDVRPTPVTPTIDEEWDHRARLFVEPQPPVLFRPDSFDSNDKVPQPSATIDEVHGPFPVGFPAVIPDPLRPILWLYEQGEQPANLFGQHEDDGWVPFAYKIPDPIRPRLDLYHDDRIQPSNTISEEDSERYWLTFLMRQDLAPVHRIVPWLNGWDIGAVPVPFIVAPPSPTSLVVLTGNTQLLYVADNGAVMPSPVSFTAGTTGPYVVKMIGSNGQPENLTGATVTLVVQSVSGGTPVVNGRTISVVSSGDGTASWDRQDAEVAYAGDYLMQTKVVRSDGTKGRYPDGSFGDPLTILPELGG